MNHPPEGDLLLTVREVAEKLRLSRSSVYKLIKNEEIPHINLACGMRMVPRVRLSHLEEFICERTRRGRVDGGSRFG